MCVPYSALCPLPCSLTNAHLDLTLTGLPMCPSERAGTQDPSTGQHRTSVGLICSHTLATTSATAPGPELNSLNTFRSQLVSPPQSSAGL